MLICIIIPVYNYPEVTNTLSAIEEQIATDSRFEIIVVDDASTDEPYDIVKQFIEKKTTPTFVFSAMYKTNGLEAQGILD